MPHAFLGRRRLLVCLGSGLMALPALKKTRAAPASFKTVDPGLLTVAVNGEMPMTSVQGDRLLGSDGEMITVIAGRLGLRIRPALMEWSATIESIRSGRADVMLGNMGWTAQRASALLLTDGVYYAGSYVAMTTNKPFAASMTVADLGGYSIGAVTGMTIIPELKKVPRATEVKLYDNSDACVRDVVAGRLDFAFLDGPLVEYMILQNPGWQLKQVSLLPDRDFPILTNKQITVFGMSQDNPDLFDAVNAGVKWLWTTKQNAAFLKKYGMANPDYLLPPQVDKRLGVDRTPEGGLTGAGAHVVKNYAQMFT